MIIIQDADEREEIEYNMAMKKNAIFLLPLLLTSCSSNEAYKFFYGNMVVSSAAMPYEKIEGKKIQWRNHEEEDYFTEIHIFSSAVSFDLFFADHSEYTIDEEERANLISSLHRDDLMLVFIFAQIPEGYSAYKRDNIQIKEDGVFKLITDNFYSYASRKNISYSFIDIKKEEGREKEIFSYTYLASSNYMNTLKEDSIRVIFQEHDPS